MNIQLGNEPPTDTDTTVLADPEQPAAGSDEEPTVPVEEDVTESDDAAAVTELSSSSSLVFETGREQGRSMGESLQQSTGIPLHTSL